MKNVLDALKWRYATKSFDASKKLNDQQVNDLLEAIRLTPTSYGLQAMKVILVNDQE